MTTIQITLDDKSAAAVTAKARSEGKSVEDWATDLMVKQVENGGSSAWVDEYVAIALKAGGNSGGWKWNREELYDE
jgi:hypothetical protein